MGSDLKNIYYELQELARDVADYRDEIDFEEEERSQVEERLDLIDTLKRKYGNNIEEILVYQKEIKEEIEHIENLDEYNKKLQKDIEKLEKQMEIQTDIMHKLREEYAKKLSQEINKELQELEMKNAKISMPVKKVDNFKKSGKDEAEFFIATNLGEDEKPLAKIASGGEMSRIMLAIKKVLADTDQTPVMVFDEIDTGISGKAANSVAEKLKGIANKHQVLCISHLPNIAAMADYNYFISKKVKGERTNTSIQLLNEKQTLEEIARISAGEVNEISLQYASKLRNKRAS